MQDAEQSMSRGGARSSLGSLAMLWRFASHYPGRIAAALAALIISSAATLAIPSGFRLVIDRGFMGGGDISRWFQYLLLIVLILALATAARFYFVSWLGERVVGARPAAPPAPRQPRAPPSLE